MQRILQLICCGLLLMLCAPPALAATESYAYDPLGRLIRWTDAQGRITEYRYDAVGNILEVLRSTTQAPAPTISMVSPLSLRRGETKTITVAGTNLAGATVMSSSPELAVATVQATAMQITFALTATAMAPLGSAVFTITTSGGSAMTAVTVNPVLPTMIVSPAPLAIPIDSIDRNFFVRLSSADTIDHVISLSTSDTNIAQVTPAQLTLTAGQTEITAKIKGLVGGVAILTLSSPGLVSTAVGVYATAEFAGINVATAPLLGIVLEGNGSTGTSYNTDLVSPLVGVTVGRYLDRIEPANFAIGSGPTSFTIFGAGLESVNAVSIVPPDGVTIAGVAANPNGGSVIANITVAPTAPTTLRKVVLTGGTGPYVPARADGDRIGITLQTPEIHSVDPLFATPGTSVTMVVRGKNLTQVTGFTFNPPTGITVSGVPSNAADGTQSTVGISIALNAPTGVRIVTAQSPTASSDATPSPANTFAVVSEIQGNINPILSPQVGVVVESVPPPQTIPVEMVSPSLGVAFGAVATGLSPSAQEAGTATTINIIGAGLQGVTAVTFAPPDGITVGTISPAPDGTSVAVGVNIDGAAVKTTRGVRVSAGTQAISFAPPIANQFRVTGPAPQILSITPQLIAVGATTVMTITGNNFLDASEVRLIPPEGISFGVLNVSPDGVTMTIPFVVAAGAVTGQKTVVVVTPAGETSATPSLANTITVYSGTATTYEPILSPVVGVVIESSTPPASTTFDPIVSPLLGVVVTEPPPAPTMTTYGITSPELRVALGPVTYSLTATPLNRGTSGSITVTGYALTSVNAATAIPNDLTFGTPVANPDGTSVTIPVTVPPAAALGQHAIRLSTGSPVLDMNLAAMLATVTAAPPTIDSIEPILGARGATIALTIRGANFTYANAIAILPGGGVQFDGAPVINAAGTIMTLGMVIDPTAAVGARVIQVTTPGGSSTSVAAPANTFTIN